MTLLEQLSNVNPDERAKFIEEIFSDDFKTNLILSNVADEVKKSAYYIKLNNYDLDDVIEKVQLEVLKNHFKGYAEKKDKSLKSFLMKYITHAEYESIAEKFGITTNDFQKFSEAKKASEKNNIPFEKENAWLIARFCRHSPTSIIRAIDTYKKLGIQSFEGLSRPKEREVCGYEA